MKRSLSLSILASLLVSLALLPANAKAQSFRPTAKKVFVSSDKGGTLTVQNLTNEDVGIGALLKGDSRLKIGQFGGVTESFTIPKNGTYDLPIRFWSPTADSAFATVVLTDNITIDSVHIAAVDLDYKKAFYADAPRVNTFVVRYPTQRFSFKVKPLTSDSEYLFLKVISRAKSFTLSAAHVALGPVAAGYDGVEVDVFRHDNYASSLPDTAKVILYTFNKHLPDTITYIGIYEESQYKPLTQVWHEFRFGKSEPGATSCIRGVIINQSDIAITVDSATALRSEFEFDSIAFPLHLAPGEFKYYRVCYTAPNYYSAFLQQSVWFYFRDQYGFLDSNWVNLSGQTKSCFSSNIDTVDFGWIKVGDTIRQRVTVTNNMDSILAVTQASLELPNDDGSWKIEKSPFPMLIAPKGSASFDVRFAPATAKGFGNYYTLKLDADNNNPWCSQYRLYMSGFGMKPGATLTKNLFETWQQTLQINARAKYTTRRFYFKNNLSKSVRVLSISLRDGTHFQITDVHPEATPFVLAAGDEMSVELSFAAEKNGHYSDALLFNTEDAFTAIEFGLSASQDAAEPTLAVIDRPNRASKLLTLYPNPTNRAIHVEVPNVRDGVIEILDLVGRQIAIAPFDGAWEWNGFTTEGNEAAGGTYIVRVSGVLADGSRFIESQKLVKR